VFVDSENDYGRHRKTESPINRSNAVAFSAKQTYVAILEYCGGEQTDRLHHQLSTWNPQYEVNVLDNASPRNRCRCVSVQNLENSYVGGGIRDCLALAERDGAEYLFLTMNDVIPITPIEIGYFQELMSSCPQTVQVSCALTAASANANNFHWMVWRRGGGIRQVPHSDILCLILHIGFIKSFGGFPASKSGWGYDREIAYQSHLQRKVQLISDRHVIAHSARQQPELGTSAEKEEELRSAYRSRYNDFESMFRAVIQDYYKIPEEPHRLSASVHADARVVNSLNVVS
jgi:hypothetical protein